MGPSDQEPETHPRALELVKKMFELWGPYPWLLDRDRHLEGLRLLLAGWPELKPIYELLKDNEALWVTIGSPEDAG